MNISTKTHSSKDKLSFQDKIAVATLVSTILGLIIALVK